MNAYGKRYVSVRQFVAYCRRLNININKRELEYYEQQGIMLPLARVVYPDEYIVQREESKKSDNFEWTGYDQWPALARLSEKLRILPTDYGDMTDAELADAFDREFEAGTNPHLLRPTTGEFRPWADYHVMVDYGDGSRVRMESAEHYYSYWQIHQLYFLQQYPDLYKNVRILSRLPEDDPVRLFRPSAPSRQRLVEFDGRRDYFDALSFWITLHDRERNRAFADACEVDGIRALSDEQFERHLSKLGELALMVVVRFQLNADDLYEFLRSLLSLLDEYDRDERHKISAELTNDIFALERLIRFVTGESRNDVAENLGETSRLVGATFRHLDPFTKERDYALELIKGVANKGKDELDLLGASDWAFTETDADRLLDYCEGSEIYIVINALGGMVAVGDDERRRNFRQVRRYTQLKNLLTGCEYLFRNLAQKSNVNVRRRADLIRVVANMMEDESWIVEFRRFSRAGMCSVRCTSDLLTQLACLLDNRRLKETLDGYWARQFLVLCLARNGAVHLYPTDARYYGTPFGAMVDSALMSMFYAWCKYEI